MAIKQGSMREALNNIYQVLINDEVLLRLLYYLPLGRNNPEPLSVELENILDMDEDKLWNIRDERIVLGEKTSDLEGKELCRIYLSSGRRRQAIGNHLLSTQEVVVSIFTHENFNDMRQEWISDRIRELIVLGRFEGMYGLLDHAKGDPRQAPRQYKQFVDIYEFGSNRR